MGDFEIGNNMGLTAEMTTTPDTFRGVMDRSKMSMYERYAGDPDALSVVKFALGIIPALTSNTSENPFPKKHDKEGIKRLVKIQKDLIRTMVRVTQGGKTPEDIEELNDFYTIASILEASAKPGLPWNLSSERKAVAAEARGWWNGIKIEAAMITALQYADFDVVIPETDEVIGVDFSGGTDFLAHKDGRVYAIDAKSSVEESKGYFVVDEPIKGGAEAVRALSQRHFGEVPITQALISLNPRFLPGLDRANGPSKQLTNIRNFLSLPEEVEEGFINDLTRLPLGRRI